MNHLKYISLFSGIEAASVAWHNKVQIEKGESNE